MRAFIFTIALIAAPFAGAEPADTGSTARLGDHPAIAARRVIAQQGYDYASKFYPHPAWLYLEAEAPRPMSDHPAVVVFRRAEQERRDAQAAATRLVADR
jgi:hypothetical protein